MLISLEEAASELRVVLPQGESAPVDVEIELTRKIEEATDIVLDYITDDDKAYWDEDTVPLRVKASIKLVLHSLYDEGHSGDPLSPAVKSLLRRMRTPSLA